MPIKEMILLGLIAGFVGAVTVKVVERDGGTYFTPLGEIYEGKKE